MDIPNNMLPRRMKPREYAIQTYDVPVENETTPDMPLDPNYWQHLAIKLVVGDEVVIHPFDGAFRLHAQVMAIDSLRHWAVLRTITLTEGGNIATGAADAEGYRIERDPVQGWRILRGRDLVEHGLLDETAAKARVAELRLRGESPKAPVRKAG